MVLVFPNQKILWNLLIRFVVLGLGISPGFILGVGWEGLRRRR